MIGLSFLAVGLLWLAVSWYLATRLPKWLGIKRSAIQWPVSAVLLLVFLMGPFVDHLVGMWQFEKLCKEQTHVWVSPNAVNAKRLQHTLKVSRMLSDKIIQISESDITLTDEDSGEVVARYNHFGTKGGLFGTSIRLGSEYGCSVENSNHLKSEKLAPLRKLITSFK